MFSMEAKCHCTDSESRCRKDQKVSWLIACHPSRTSTTQSIHDTLSLSTTQHLINAPHFHSKNNARYKADNKTFSGEVESGSCREFKFECLLINFYCRTIFYGLEVSPRATVLWNANIRFFVLTQWKHNKTLHTRGDSINYVWGIRVPSNCHHSNSNRLSLFQPANNILRYRQSFVLNICTWATTATIWAKKSEGFTKIFYRGTSKVSRTQKINCDIKSANW